MQSLIQKQNTLLIIIPLWFIGEAGGSGRFFGRCGVVPERGGRVPLGVAGGRSHPDYCVALDPPRHDARHQETSRE